MCHSLGDAIYTGGDPGLEIDVELLTAKQVERHSWDDQEAAA